MSLESGNIDPEDVKKLSDKELEMCSKAWDFEFHAARNSFKIALSNRTIVNNEVSKRRIEKIESEYQ